ncbi:MAG: phosphatase [Proteobacteria bacterium]|nr:phosphatase [Pseudomonadota bacterium]
MRQSILAVSVTATLSLLSANTYAANIAFENFTPLIGNAAAGSLPESAPFQLSSPNFTQTALANRANQNLLSPNSNSGSWDMITANENGQNAGRYLFMPFETSSGGVQRVDLRDPNYNTRTVTIVAPGTQGFVSGDASRWTPWGTYLTAEESWGNGSTKGRLFEVTNPTTASANAGDFVQRSIIPRVSHEGLTFDKNNTLYFIDELNGGSVYKYVSANPNAKNGNDFFAAGQTFVLKVGSGGQVEGSNGPAITGNGTWIAITDAQGKAIPGVSTVLADGTIDGRVTADHADIKGTGFNRPEDLEIKTLANGQQVIYFTTTDSDNDGNSANGRGRVYVLNLGSGAVQLAADNTTKDMATNLAVGTPWSNPDNLAIDAKGNIYVIEDQDGGKADIWFLRDINDDGIADEVGKWASLSTPGAEPTGLYFDPFDPNVAYVNVQHPRSGDDMLIRINAVPEPASLALILGGLGVLGGVMRRKKAN